MSAVPPLQPRDKPKEAAPAGRAPAAAWPAAVDGLEWDMAPKTKEAPQTLSWLDRAVFHESLQNFFTSFVNLPVSLVTRKGDEETWWALVPSNQSPNLVHFEGYLGRLDARQRYHLPMLAKARRTGQPVVGDFAGAHDLFVPLLHRGKVEAVLVSGPFFKSVPSAQDLSANFKGLTGLRPEGGSPLLIEYARIAVETPVLEAVALKAYIAALTVAGRYLAGSSSGLQVQSVLKRIQNEVFAPFYPWRAWRFVERRRDRRFWEFYVQPRLTPWDRVELGLSRHPTVALALCLLRDSRSKASELDEISDNAAMQRRCFLLAKRFPEAIAGRMDHSGAFLLFSPGPKTPAPRLRQQVVEMARVLGAELRRDFGREVAVGVSRLDGPADRLPDAMHEAAVALQLGTRTSRPLVFFDEQTLDVEGSGPLRLLSRLGDLREAYSKALKEETDLAADQFLADVLLQSRLSAEVMRLHFHYAFWALRETLARRALLPPHRLEQFQKLWLERLGAEASAYGLHMAFREMLQAFLGLITAPGEGDRGLRLDQARRYVDQHFLEPISIRDAARVGGFSPSRFSRLFRKAEGTGFGDYLLRRRLEHAKHLLLHSQLPMQQVAVEAGFSSLSYFSQAFKKATGKNPTQFRAAGRNA